MGQLTGVEPAGAGDDREIGRGGAPGLDDQTMVLADGRTLGWAEYGDPAGRPLFFLHGTPGSRLDAYTLHDACAARGVRIIAPDRPGMGRSTPQPRRHILDHNREVVALAGHLGLGRFSVLAYSGGGPYGIACAARLADRLDDVVVVSGCSPPDRPAALADTGSIDRVLTALARRAPFGADVVLRSMVLGAKGFPRIGLRMWEADLSESDREAFKAMVAAAPVNPLGSFLESMRAGPSGVVTDYRLLAEPWGFVPEEVALSVHFWHGDADPIVPLHHAQDLVARMPQSRLDVVAGAGHLLVRSAAERIVGALS